MFESASFTRPPDLPCPHRGGLHPRRARARRSRYAIAAMVPDSDAASASAEPRLLPSHYSRCFGCGDDHLTGLHMQVYAAGDEIRGSFLVTEHHQGAPGLAHGGVIAAAVDEAMGFLIFLVAKPAVTARLEVDYRKPVPVGSRLDLVGVVERIDGRKIHATIVGRVDGHIHVKARSLFMQVGVEHFASYAERADEQMERPYNP